MTEKELHKQICQYLSIQYPKVRFNTDLSGLKLSIGQSVQIKKLRSNSGWPDIFIAHKSEHFNGLFLEVKKDASEIWLKNGEIKNNTHINEQWEMLTYLNNQGYYAFWAYSFDQAKRIIDNYMNNKFVL